MSIFWGLTDIGLPSLDDEMALFGEAGEAEVLARLRAAGVRRGALKRGAGGPLPLGEAGVLPEFPPATRVVDTTAAGDSFNGAYLAAVFRGEPEMRCLAAGHGMAVEVIGHPGAIMPRYAMVYEDLLDVQSMHMSCTTHALTKTVGIEVLTGSLACPARPRWARD